MPVENKSKDKKGGNVLYKHIMKYKILEWDAEVGNEKIRPSNLSNLLLIWEQKNFHQYIRSFLVLLLEWILILSEKCFLVLQQLRWILNSIYEK